MAAYDLEEQEQLAELKAWWKEHGGTVMLGATLALAAFGAWNGWMWYQRSQAAQAAVLYAALQVLEARPHPGFEVLYAMQRGDILATQKRRAEARAAYQAALEKAQPGAVRETLRLKLDALGDA